MSLLFDLRHGLRVLRGRPVLFSALGGRVALGQAIATGASSAPASRALRTDPARVQRLV